jgi:hypothetical protein
MKVNAAALLRVTKAGIMAEITPLLQEKIEIPHGLSYVVVSGRTASDYLQLHSPLQGKILKVGRSRKQLPIEGTKSHIRKTLWGLSRELLRSAHMLLKPIYISQRIAWLFYLM